MILCADATKIPLPDLSADLVLGSPPYCDARTYGIGAQRDCQAWIDWMLDVTTEALRLSKGAVIWVAAGVTRDRNYWPACEGLMYEWWKRGGSMYRPVYWHRVGIPGSGGDQWFRADVEYCMCFKRPGKLPFTDNTAMGHPPKWAPGGEMAHRLRNGSRVNQWGPVSNARRGRRANGEQKRGSSPSHVVTTIGKKHTKAKANGEMEEQIYLPPAIANPGNLIRTTVGGGQMGDRMAHENEAPYPEDLAEFFIRSLCPPDGLVLDPFSGSGTTAKTAIAFGRKFIASDIRESQCELTRRRIASVQKSLLT